MTRGYRMGTWAALLLAAFVLPCTARAEPTPALRQVIAAAETEGQLHLTWSQSTYGGTQGASLFQAAMNKMFGTKIKIVFVPGPEMARVANQLATEFSASQPAHTDILIGSAPQIHILTKLGFIDAIDWRALQPERITPEMLELDGRVIRMVTGLSGVTYNSALAPAVPKTLEDFLKPAWTGKIASTPYAASFDVLLADDVWGRERTLTYVKALSRQVSGLIRCGDGERIATGEYLALVMDCTGQDALQWQERGAPLAQLMPIDAAQLRYYYFAIPRNSKNQNAAKLFTLFMLSPEGQKLGYDTWKTDLHLLPGSRMARIVADYKAAGAKFKEVTVDWWGQHPEIDTTKSEMIKILTTR